MHRFAALRTFDCNLINIRTVQLHRLCGLIAAHLKELLTASDGMHMAAVLALPDIQRSTPETSLTDALRNPVDRVVVCNQVILNLCHLDKPGFARIIDQRRITAPAVRILMLKLRRIVQLAFLFQINQNRLVRILYKQARIRGILCHISLAVYKLYKRKIVFASNTSVVLTECRRNVNNTCTV